MFRWRWSIGLAVRVCALIALTSPALAAKEHPKLDRTLAERAPRPGWSRVIVTLTDASPGATLEIEKLGGRLGRRLGLINGQVVELPNRELKKLAAHPRVARIDEDRETRGTLSRVSTITGARAAREKYGFDGAGVGVAVIDSGVTAWHDDLTYNGTSTAASTRDGQRVVSFVDYVGGRTEPYDDNGHGTHVAGIIAGNGYDSNGDHAGIAPGAHLVSLKVLDADGRGVISNVISALEYAVVNRGRFNIRVVNLSVGAAVTSSYRTDPLTLAARRATDAGLVVVTASGNLGKNAGGELQWGGIMSPGNAPWVLTVGAATHQGTNNRLDDRVADYSSSGPSAIDYEAKPDMVAYGTGVVSLSDAASRFYTTKASYLVDGAVATTYKEYLSLSGSSMAAPQVSGTVALMLQANPSLTPNFVKAVLQYTAQVQPDTHPLRQGAGFLNTKGAIELAHYFATARAGDAYPNGKGWGRTIHWGSRRLAGGAISPSGNAWALNVVWGTARDGEGDNIVWGTVSDEADNIVWGTVSGEGDNIVWGTVSDEGDNIVWGTADEGDNIVWGTDCGGDDCFNIVWGTVSDEGDNIVWGTLVQTLNIVWGTADEGDNIVWGTGGEIDLRVWSTASDEGDNIVWGTASVDALLFETEVDAVTEWEALFDPPPAATGGGTAYQLEAL